MVIDEVTAGGLAKMCEQATGNEDIAWFDDLCRAIEAIDPRSNVNGSCRDYVRSVDGAISLVPASCTYSIQTPTSATVYLKETRRRWHGKGAGPALALCAAALKALAEL